MAPTRDTYSNVGAPRSCVLHSMALPWCKLRHARRLAHDVHRSFVVAVVCALCEAGEQQSNVRMQVAARNPRATGTRRVGGEKWRTLARSERRTLLVSPLSALDPLHACHGEECPSRYVAYPSRHVERTWVLLIRVSTVKTVSVVPYALIFGTTAAKIDCIPGLRDRED